MRSENFATRIHASKTTKQPIVIGVHTGMGALAGYKFSERLHELISQKYAGNRKGDKAFPIIINYSDTNTPKRDKSIGDDAEIIRHLLKGTQLFKSAGAQFILAPCNTLMHFRNQIQAASGIEIIDIIEATARHTVEQHPGVKTVGLISTKATAQYGLYHAAFAKYGIKVIIPDEDKLNIVDNVISSLKQGRHLIGDAPQLRKDINPCIEYLKSQGAQTIVLGCTEIPLLLTNDKNKDISFVSSIEALAQAGIAKLTQVERTNCIRNVGAVKSIRSML